MIDFDDFDTEPEGEDLTLAAAGMAEGGYSATVLPPDLICREDRLLWERIRTRELLGLPPAGPMDVLLRETLREARSLKGGHKTKVAAVLAAVRLALAREHGIRIPTHAQGIARHLGIRKARLLELTRIAARVASRERVSLELPEWLKRDWS